MNPGWVTGRRVGHASLAAKRAGTVGERPSFPPPSGGSRPAFIRWPPGSLVLRCSGRETSVTLGHASLAREAWQAITTHTITYYYVRV